MFLILLFLNKRHPSNMSHVTCLPISAEKRKKRYLKAVRDMMAKLYTFGEARPLPVSSYVRSQVSSKRTA